MPSPIRPLHVGKFVPPPYAGIEAHVDTLLRSIAPQAQSILVASKLPFQRRVSSSPPPYRLLAIPSAGSLASVALSPGVLGAVRREFDAQRANLLHLHAPNPWGDLAALRTKSSVPVVMSWHSDIVQQKLLFKLYEGVQRRALQRADRIIVGTPKHFESSQQLRALDVERKIVLLPYGIDFARLDATVPDARVHTRIDQWANGRPIILTVGRHVYYKGYEFLLRAMVRLISDGVLVMVGTGPLRHSLQRLAETLGISERVLFLGEVDDSGLVAAIQRCDVFTLPSIERSEAFGIASAEAMAFGKPSVVCALGNGVNHLNRAGVTGLETEPKDIPALTDALDMLIADGSLRTRMGEAARAWVRSEFSLEAMRDRTLALYRELL